MKVKDLIAVLETFDPELDILHSSDAEGNKVTSHPVIGRSFYTDAEYGEVDLIHPDDMNAHINIKGGVVFYGT